MSESQVLILKRPRRHGRPTLFGERASRRFEFVATPRQGLDLQSVARDEGKTVAAVIRDAVDEYVSDYRERRVFGHRDGRIESY